VRFPRAGITRSLGRINRTTGSRKEHRMSLLWIILIVVLVLALLGFFGRGRY
jgi:flagellar basal body-associated protein FliL